MGARELYMTLKAHHFVGIKNNNGRLYLSQRNAMEEMGVPNRAQGGRGWRMCGQAVEIGLDHSAACSRLRDRAQAMLRDCTQRVCRRFTPMLSSS
jgi:hypothetical protein